MKKVIIISLAIMSMFSCVSKKNADKLQNQKDSLSVALAEKDSVINSVFASLNDITTNLNAIKSRENIISSNLDNGELKKQPTTQIQEDVAAIDELLKENHIAIERLKQNVTLLKNANVKIKSLDDLVKKLEAQVAEKDASIASLKTELADAKIQITTLGKTVEDLNVKVGDLDQSNKDLQDQVQNQATMLNTAYYIIGSQKELLAQEIIYKSGFIGKTLKINENRSLESFTKVDIRNFDQLIIDKKDVTIVSTHPEGSYELVMGSKNLVQVLNIIDKQKFWEYSKVLVVSYK